MPSYRSSLANNELRSLSVSLRKIVPSFNNQKETVFTQELMFETRAEANAMFEKYFR